MPRAPARPYGRQVGADADRQRPWWRVPLAVAGTLAALGAATLGRRGSTASALVLGGTCVLALVPTVRWRRRHPGVVVAGPGVVRWSEQLSTVSLLTVGPPVLVVAILVEVGLGGAAGVLAGLLVLGLGIALVRRSGRTRS